MNPTSSIPLRDLRRPQRAAGAGRAVDPQALAEVRDCIGGLPLRRDLLIEHLHAIHDRHGRLRTGHIAALAALHRMAQVEVFEVASFYHHFHLASDDEAAAAPARLTVQVCGSISCAMAGSAALREALPAALGPGVRVVDTPCIGRCATAPSAVVHQRTVPHATVESVTAEVAAGRIHDDMPDAVGMAAYVAQGGYRLLRDCHEGRREVESVLAALDDARLRGLGGAGFPAGRKWRIVRAEPAPHMMAVNIDEGEPGTYKDRHWLERDPHRFIEGMLLAAWAVGIDRIVVFLRGEYHGCRALLQRELAALQASPPVAGLPAVALRRGAGAYICGDESAMLEAIEGRRGMPRLRPPYVAQVGLFGRPTLVHNLETLFWVRDVVEQGADRFAAPGRRGRLGMRSFSLSGRVRSPGVKRAPAGTTLRELVDEHGGGLPEGHELYGYLPGGASGGILPASLADLPLDFDTLQPHGCFIGSAAVIVLTKSAHHVDRAVDAARNLLRFFEDESCGQCTPCRVGTAKMRELIERERWDRALLAELSQAMRDASICGLGQSAPNPVDSVMQHFAHELDDPGAAT